MAGRVGRRELQPGVGLAVFGDDLHLLLAREVHHRRVLGEAVHEQRAHAPIACAQVGAREQRTADAAPAMAFEYRDSELGVRAAASDVRRTGKVQGIVEYAEQRIALEVDAFHVSAHRRIVESATEAQAPVRAAERQEVRLEGWTFRPRELANQDVGQIFWKDSRAAASVASISAVPCAAETKPAS